ncbi:MAG: hypothetical protein LRY51_03940 [Geovibrio sp.]|nr:hypothetical protein [Geovibrio sp.]
MLRDNRLIGIITRSDLIKKSPEGAYPHGSQ